MTSHSVEKNILAFSGKSHSEFRNNQAFAALKNDGSVVTWGSSAHGGDSSSVSDQINNGVIQLFSSDKAFAALKNDGSVVTWGKGGEGWSAYEPKLNSGVIKIFSSGNGFTALKDDGSVVISWGNYTDTVGSQLDNSVRDVYSTVSSFAAVKDDGSVVAWTHPGGEEGNGGDISSVANFLKSNVQSIYSTYKAFAALKDDGSVVTWGRDTHGGDSSSVSSLISTGVSKIFTSGQAFAALKNDGSVVVWGCIDIEPLSGSEFDTPYPIDGVTFHEDLILFGDVKHLLQEAVSDIFTSRDAFAALKDDGSVITWGSKNAGGDSSSVANLLASGVKTIYATEYAFAALKNDGSVVTWGGGPNLPYIDFGGTSPTHLLQSDVIEIYASGLSFAALKNDGSVITWGSGTTHSDDIAAKLTSGVVGFANPLTDDWYNSPPLTRKPYSISTSTLESDEGSSFTTNISTFNVPDGTILYWSILGENIQDSDLSLGELLGSDSVVNNQIILSHKFANDLATEGTETFNIFLFNDPSRENQIAKSDLITILDTSTSLPPTYKISASSLNLDEGETLTTTVETTNLAEGTILYWNLSGVGIHSTDFTPGLLDGYGKVGADGTFTFSHVIANDLTTEGNELLRIKLFKDAKNTEQVGETVWPYLIDTSIGQPLQYDYEIITNKPSYVESELINIKVKTYPVKMSSYLYWEITGSEIDSSDISYSYRRSSIITDENGEASINIYTKQDDNYNEGNELAYFKLYPNSKRLEAELLAQTSFQLEDWDIDLNINISDSINYGEYFKVIIEPNGLPKTDWSTSKLYWDIKGEKFDSKDFRRSSGTLRFYSGDKYETEIYINSSNDEVVKDLSFNVYNDSEKLNRVHSKNFTILSSNVSFDDSNSLTFSNNFDEYKFYNRGNGRYEIKVDSRYDEITGIDKLKFVDKTTSVLDDIIGVFDQITGLNTDSGKMFRLYNAAFARFPDSDGLKYWIGKYSSGEDDERAVAMSFLKSPEFATKYGTNVSTEVYVNNLYQNVLGRVADLSGLLYWSNQLNNGAETRHEVLLGFSESIENKLLFTEMTGFG